MDKIILLLTTAILFLSCGNKPLNAQDVKVEFDSKQYPDTILYDNETIIYLETFRSFLLENKIEELANLIHFPIEGDYMWENTNQKGERILIFNGYQTREKFLENYSRLFNSDLADLLKQVDFKKSLQKDYHVIINKSPNIELTLTVGFTTWIELEKEQRPTRVSIEVDYDETDCSICEKGVIYHFQKIDGKIKLTDIQFVG